mmetsp:Transcript_31943/g.51582  ORF Transcript_31943/g.51582 Transcript_31943/m.51582 type:complete len:205 (+) Transcript_31943:542-1156(+)
MLVRYAFLLLIASPSGSRTIGITCIFTRMQRSRTILLRTTHCCASLAPKKAISGSTMLNSLQTTVAIPLKNPSLPPRDGSPSSISEQFSTLTKVLLPGGYISSVFGMKTRSTPPTDSSLRKSPSTSRGYDERSSVGANWVGFTKMLTTVYLHSCLLRFTSDRCPSCKYPIVGTKPTVPSHVEWSARTSGTVLTIVIEASEYSFS